MPVPQPSTPGMDVFLIPTAKPGHYEIYYEAPEAEPEEDEDGPGLIARVRRKFSAMLREAEDARHRGESEVQRAGLIARARHRVMGFVVERIAEQRLLWHLRTATEVCAQIPADLSDAEASRIIRETLKKDADHHFRWLWIDLLLLILSAPLMLVPGPNVPGFYFTFQVIGHFLSFRGAKQGLSGVKWEWRPNAALSELRTLIAASAPHRSRRIHELAAHLRLQRLATFFEEVAAPTA